MSTIDNRVVKMAFDNAQFEKNAATSIHTLDKLKQSLNFTGATKGLSDIEAKTKSIKMDALVDGVQTVADKFNTLGVIGFTVLQNLTNDAVNFGKRIASALTIEPIKMGFEEYETQINAVQTILANTQDKLKSQGLDDQQRLDLVNQKLDELNTYADKTIYNFTEMTRNIGTFTAAGVELNTATNAIQGIANLAAVSGSNSQQASTAMYQLSQALASGTVKLMDWNSVVNAGMGGEVFQKELKDTARAHGIAIDQIIEENGSFRDSLQEGWLTSEILTETLEKFTATTEGLTEEEISLQREMWKTRGYTDEQIDSIFELGEMSTNAATKVKTFSQLIDTTKEALQSGWTQSWEYIIGDFEQAKELWTGISDVLNDYIGKSAEARNAALKGWNESENGRKAVLEGLANAFKALLSVMEPIKEAWDSVFPAITADKLIELSTKFRDFTSRLALTEEQMGKLKQGFIGIFSIIKSVAGFVGRNLVAVWDAFKTVISSIFPSGGDILNSFSNFGDILTRLAGKIDGVHSLEDGIRKLGEVIANFIGKAKEFLHIDELGDKFHNFIETLKNDSGDIRMPFFDKLGEIMDKLKSMAEQILPVVKEKFDEVREGLANMIKGVSSEAGKFDGLDLIGALGLGIGGIGIAKIAGIFKKVEEVVDDAKSWKDGLVEIKDALVDTFGAIQQNLKADALKSIAIAIGILAASLFVISLIDTEKLIGSLAALSALMWEVNWMLNNLSGISGKAKNIVGAASLLMGMAVAIGVLAIAMRIIGGMNTQDILEGLLAVTILITELTVVSAALSEVGGKITKGASSLILMAIAIGLLAIPIKILGNMDLESLSKGLISVMALIFALAAASALTSLGKMGISAGLGMMAMAGAIIMLVGPVKELGALDLKTLATGLGSVAIMLVELTAAAKLMPKNMVSIGIGMLAMAVAIRVMTDAVKDLGSLSVGELAKGLISLAIALGLLVISANLMKTALPGAAAMLIMAAAIVPLSLSLKLLSTIPLLNLITGLIGLAAGIAILGAASVILAPIAPAMAAVAGAMILFGIAATLFAGAFALISVAVATGGVALILFIRQAISLLPFLGQMIGELIVSLAVAVGKGAPAIGEAFKAIIETILNVVVTEIPNIVNALLELLNQLLQSLLEYVPQMANAVLQIILGILQAIADNIQQIVEAGMSIVIGLINGISEKLPELIDSAFNLIISFIDGLATAIDENHNALFDAIGHLIQSIIDAIIDGVFKVGNAAGSLIAGEGGILDTLGGFFNDLFNAGANLVQGFIDGLTSMPGAIWNAACGLANDAWNAITSTLDEHSPSRLTFGGGANFTKGFINGILSLKDKAAKESSNVAIAAMSAFDSAINSDYQPTISPVMDLTNIQNGIGLMGGMLGSMPNTIGINGAIDAQTNARLQAMQVLGSGSDYSSILSGMMGLRDDLAKYSDIMSKMQIVMDSGTLVGQLTPGIDRQLGRNAILAGRGV